MIKHVATRLKFLEKVGRTCFSSLIITIYVIIYADAISLAIPACTNGLKKCTSPKRAAHRTTWRMNITCKFQHSIHKKNVFFLHYVCSPQHRAMRLLSRRYDLTNTGYKFLEIGINVDPPSYVEIILGDHRGHELLLSLETWMSLYEQRWNIYKMLRNEYKDNFIL